MNGQMSSDGQWHDKTRLCIHKQQIENEDKIMIIPSQCGKYIFGQLRTIQCNKYQIA